MKRGQVILEEFESAVLRGNAAGDPHVRAVPVYLPPSYGVDRERRYPVTFVLESLRSTASLRSATQPAMPSPSRARALRANSDSRP